MLTRAIAAVLTFVVLPAQVMAADVTEGRVALVSLDSLGMDADRVARLETLFRVEIEKLSPNRSPSGREVREVASRAEHRDCGGEATCLVAIGKALKVDVVVSGSVAELGDAHVVNIKALSVSSGEEIGRIASEPLRSAQGELIENIRISAYRLLAESKLRGSISIVADIDGASIIVNGEVVATTPLTAPVSNLPMGRHKLEVRAKGYSGFTQEIDVAFEKTTRVVVTLADEPAGLRGLGESNTTSERPFYRKTWFWVAVGVTATALVAGALIGNQLGKTETAQCPCDDPEML